VGRSHGSIARRWAQFPVMRVRSGMELSPAVTQARLEDLVRHRNPLLAPGGLSASRREMAAVSWIREELAVRTACRLGTSAIQYFLPPVTGPRRVRSYAVQLALMDHLGSRLPWVGCDRGHSSCACTRKPRRVTAAVALSPSGSTEPDTFLGLFDAWVRRSRPTPRARDADWMLSVRSVRSRC